MPTPEDHARERQEARAATYTTNVARLRALIGGCESEETEDE